MRLVLWDIDGTLLDSGGAGVDAFRFAFERTVGRAPRELAPVAGRTDHEIALETLALNGVEDGKVRWPDFAAALARALVELRPVMGARGHAMAGAHEAIATLAGVDGVVQSVLTGNIRANAQTKLDTFGLLEGLDLEVGAYGSDDRSRPALVSIARGRAARRYGEEPAPEGTVLIGDTPLDVAAGHAGGVRVVGVATGPCGVAELEEAGAEPALADLRDTEAVKAAVLAADEAGRT